MAICPSYLLITVIITTMNTKLQTRKSFRTTRQRQAVLEELRMVKTHPTANEVYQMVRKRLPNISLGTVYRNLEILSEKGIIQKLELARTRRRYDGMNEVHYHARCVSCGRVDDVPLNPMQMIDESVTRLTDYEIFSHRLEFIGLCPDCRKKRGLVSSGTPGAPDRTRVGGRGRTPISRKP